MFGNDDFFIDFWKYVEHRLHEESLLHYPINSIRLILREYIIGILNEFNEDSYKLILQSFLATCTGTYLDLRGAEMGIVREEDEDDTNYRKRLLTALYTKLTVNYVKKMGVLIYSTKTWDQNIRSYMTSFNPYMHDTYAGFVKTDIAVNLVSVDMICDHMMKYYLQGWG